MLEKSPVPAGHKKKTKKKGEGEKKEDRTTSLVLGTLACARVHLFYVECASACAARMGEEWPPEVM